MIDELLLRPNGTVRIEFVESVLIAAGEEAVHEGVWLEAGQITSSRLNN